MLEVAMKLPTASLIVLTVLHAPAASGAAPAAWVTAGETQEWVLHTGVPLRTTIQMCIDWCSASGPGGTPVQRNRKPTDRFIEADALSVRYPVFPGCASATVDEEAVVSTLKTDGVLRDDAPARNEAGSAGGRWGTWEVKQTGRFELVELRVQTPMTCRETKFDERAAAGVAWPAQWPESVRDALAPSQFVESDDPAVAALVKKWAGADPKARTPALTAKAIMGGVVEHVQPNGDGLTYVKMDAQAFLKNQNQRIDVRSKGFPQALIIGGAASAAKTGKGSPHDLACLFVAACRAAGIPARLVFGLDTAESEKRSALILRTWAEFHLYDEESKQAEWIPADPMRQREFGSRAPPLDQAWKYFGNNDELDTTVPISFLAHPPAAAGRVDAPEALARAGGVDLSPTYPGHKGSRNPQALPNPGPAFWGWAVDPNCGAPDHTLAMIWAEHPVKRGGEPARRGR